MLNMHKLKNYFRNFTTHMQNYKLHDLLELDTRDRNEKKSPQLLEFGTLVRDKVCPNCVYYLREGFSKF